MKILCRSGHWMKENEMQVMPVNYIKLISFFTWKYKGGGSVSIYLKTTVRSELNKRTTEDKILRG